MQDSVGEYWDIAACFFYLIIDKFVSWLFYFARVMPEVDVVPGIFAQIEFNSRD